MGQENNVLKKMMEIKGYILVVALLSLTVVFSYSSIDPEKLDIESIYRPVQLASTADLVAPKLVVIKKDLKCLLAVKFRLEQLGGITFAVFAPKNIFFDDVSFLYKSRLIVFSELMEPVDPCALGKRVHYE